MFAGGKLYGADADLTKIRWQFDDSRPLSHEFLCAKCGREVVASPPTILQEYIKGHECDLPTAQAHCFLRALVESMSLDEEDEERAFDKLLQATDCSALDAKIKELLGLPRHEEE